MTETETLAEIRAYVERVKATPLPGEYADGMVSVADGVLEILDTASASPNAPIQQEERTMIDLAQIKERRLRYQITENASPNFIPALLATAGDVPSLVAEVERLQGIVLQVAADQNPDNRLLARAVEIQREG